MGLFNAFKRAFSMVQRSARWRLGLLAIANVVVAGLDMAGILLLVPLLALLGPGSTPDGSFVNFAERILGTDSAERIALALALAATGLFIAKGLSAVVLLWVQTGVLNKAQVALSERILKSFIKAPWLTQQSSSTGGLVRTTVASTESAMFIIAGGISLVGEGAVFTAVVAALVIVNPALATAALLYLLFAGLVFVRVARRPIQTRGTRVQTEGARMNSSLIELVGGIKELTVRSTSLLYVNRYARAASQYLSANRLIAVTNQSMRYLLEILMIAGVAIVISFAAVSGSATTVLVSIGVLLAGGLRLIPALNALLIAVNVIRANEPALTVIEQELNRLSPYEGLPESEPADSLDAGGQFVPSGSFSVKHLTFRYPTRDTDAISDVSVSIAFGEALGVVGASGSGKSTFVDLLLALLEPTRGSIAIDGRPLANHVTAWRSQVGFVPQEIFLVDDTLEANIVFGDQGEADTKPRVAEAVRLAHLEDVVAALPDGLETMLGERGVRLSGGQRQRVGIARALYHAPSILILDEATSALDNETERKIGETIASLHGTITSVVIAHRLSTVRSCDKILFLEDGKVSGFGSFDELDRGNAAFARLVELGTLRGAA